MATSKTFLRSFAGGEISTTMYGRVDDVKYQTGAATFQNMVATPQGPAQNRAGFAFVSTTKNNGVARLIPFTFNNTDTLVIELGDSYMRFHSMGQTVVYSPVQPAFKPSDVVTYTVANPTVIGFVAHPFSTGDSVVFATRGILPGGGIPEYPTGLGYGPYNVVVIDANSFRIVDGSGNPVEITAAQGPGQTIVAQPNYPAGMLVSYGGHTYYRPAVPPAYVVAPDTDPSSDGFWTVLPADLTYEIPTPYTADQLFAIKYVQSADVMSLTHGDHPAAELRRYSDTNWTLIPINFGAVIGTPQNVTATASPGYLAQIESVTEVAATTSQPAHSLIQTAAAHTLSLGDGVYVNGLKNGATDYTGFYLVAGVPIDTDGNLITNQLWLMDYSGATLVGVSPGYTLDPGTIQLGTKVFDLNTYYAVAAIAADNVSQSQLSAEVSALNNLSVPGSYNRITWDAVPGASTYYVFEKKNGLWGYIGQASGTSFIDNNIAPDFSITNSIFDNPFPNTGNDNPEAVGYVEQRRVFAATYNNPQTVWMTNSGTESQLSYSLPSQDTDRISLKIASLEVSRIVHVIPLTQMLLLTQSAEYASYTTNDGPVTGTTVGFRPQSFVGSSDVKPVVVNNSVVYCAARGGHVRELGFNLQSNGFVTGDISLRAIHRFDNLTILDSAFAKSPIPIVWFISSDGTLLGLTYVPEQQIGAWHAHSTQGTFESIACAAEGDEDHAYVVVNRTINGQTVRYIERQASRLVSTLAACFFVDAGVTFTATSGPVIGISGLTWLEGCTVSVLADGAVQNQKVVVGGKITLDHEASVVQIGLPYVSDLQTLPPVMQVDGYGQGRELNLNKVFVRVDQSIGISAGPDEDSLIDYKQRTDEPYGSPPNLFSGQAEIVLQPEWNENGQLLIRQSNPLPLTVVSLTIDVSIGG